MHPVGIGGALCVVLLQRARGLLVLAVCALLGALGVIALLRNRQEAP